jgi:cell division septum initiation protein DivIVA
MTDDERQRTMDFIIEQQAQFTVNVELLRQRVDTLTTNVEGLREAQARTDAAVGALTNQVQNIARQQAHINEVVAVIADAQQHRMNDSML